MWNIVVCFPLDKKPGDKRKANKSCNTAYLNRMNYIIVIGAAISAVVTAVVCLLVYLCCCRKKASDGREAPTETENEEKEDNNNRKQTNKSGDTVIDVEVGGHEEIFTISENLDKEKKDIIENGSESDKYDAILSLVQNLSEFLNGPTVSEDLEANKKKDPLDNTSIKENKKKEIIAPKTNQIDLDDLDGFRKDKVNKNITKYNTGKENKNNVKPLKRLDNRKPLLSNLAISKHIDPNCHSEYDAERKSIERNRINTSPLNTVFTVNPQDFHFDILNGRLKVN